MAYMMSDIHGKTSCFHSAIKRINLKPEDILYILFQRKHYKGGRRV